MADNIAISVKNVSKNFKLPHEKADSVKSLFVNPFNKDRKSFEVQHALHDISFDIPKGEFFGIVGRNGSGKSTLLKIIAGIYKPNEGHVTVNGRLVPFIELGVGFNPELTGRENVYLNGALMGFSEKEVDQKYDAIVDFAELERFMDQKLKNYSSGMQVRLAFSVATILADSDILLIDEVLAVGDADFQKKCFRYFLSLKKQKRTVVFVSHDMDAVERFCDRAVLIDKNRLVMTGSPKKVAQEYRNLFIEHVAVNEDESLDESDKTDKVMTFSKLKVGLTNDTVKITATIVTHGDIQSPVLGFSINRDDRKIVGTNTKNENAEIGIIAANSQKQITWTVPNIFSNGTYTVDLTAHSEDLTEVYDWCADAIEFNVTKNKNSKYYDIVLPFTFESR